MEARPARIQMVIRYRYRSPPSHGSYCEILGTSTSPVQNRAARGYGLHIDAYCRRWRRRSRRWTHGSTHRLSHRRSRRRHGTRKKAWKTQIARILHAWNSTIIGSPPECPKALRVTQRVGQTTYAPAAAVRPLQGCGGGKAGIVVETAGSTRLRPSPPWPPLLLRPAVTPTQPGGHCEATSSRSHAFSMGSG